MAGMMSMSLPEPTTMIAAVSAVLQGIQTWVAYRDKGRASADFDTTFREASEDEETMEEAAHLVDLVPSDILGTMAGRVDNCWKKFRGVIEPGRDFLPDEVDEAVDQVKARICRELRRIYSLNGSIPPGKLSDYWVAYCST